MSCFLSLLTYTTIHSSTMHAITPAHPHACNHTRTPAHPHTHAHQRLTTVLDQVLNALDSYEADAMPIVVKFVRFSLIQTVQFDIYRMLFFIHTVSLSYLYCRSFLLLFSLFSFVLLSSNEVLSFLFEIVTSKINTTPTQPNPTHHTKR